MTLWILDDRPLRWLADLAVRFGKTGLDVSKVTIGLAGETRRAQLAGIRDRRQSDPFREAMVVLCEQAELLDPEMSDVRHTAILYGHYRTRELPKNAHLAEHQALTCVLAEPEKFRDVVYVTADKGALYLASMDLGWKRASTFVDFVREGVSARAWSGPPEVLLDAAVKLHSKGLSGLSPFRG